MYKAFNSAFSDYIIPISLTLEQFKKRFLSKLQINFELSAGAFDSNDLIGFIFTGLGTYGGRKVAYNGGTGVLPEYRGNRITARLYSLLFPLFRERNIEASVLEVITDNEKALKVYKEIGFRESKYFHCFRKDLYTIDNVDDPNLKYIKVIHAPDWRLFRSFSNSSPSFLDYYDVITRNISNEQIIVFENENTIVGYAIYQPELGRISQLAVAKNYRKRGVGTALTNYIIKNSQTIAVTALNVDSKSSDLIQFFKKLGFENQLDQYEMYLPLS
jgi:ribosomal protein S18 acetylase RimI-like enzyme